MQKMFSSLNSTSDTDGPITFFDFSSTSTSADLEDALGSTQTDDIEFVSSSSSKRVRALLLELQDMMNQMDFKNERLYQYYKGYIANFVKSSVKILILHNIDCVYQSNESDNNNYERLYQLLVILCSVYGSKTHTKDEEVFKILPNYSSSNMDELFNNLAKTDLLQCRAFQILNLCHNSYYKKLIIWMRSQITRCGDRQIQITADSSKAFQKIQVISQDQSIVRTSITHVIPLVFHAVHSSGVRIAVCKMVWNVTLVLNAECNKIQTCIFEQSGIKLCSLEMEHVNELFKVQTSVKTALDSLRLVRL
jgi:hypothetical protein